MLVSSGTVTIKGKYGVDSEVDTGAVSVSGGTLTVEGESAAFTPNFLENVDQHIILGEGVGVISGAYDSASVTIGIPKEPALLGDADGSGEVDTIDATIIQRYATKVAVPYDEDQLMNADIDGDGDLTIVDATFIQRFATKVKTPYPIGELIG